MWLQIFCNLFLAGAAIASTLSPQSTRDLSTIATPTGMTSVSQTRSNSELSTVSVTESESERHSTIVTETVKAVPSDEAIPSNGESVDGNFTVEVPSMPEVPSGMQGTSTIQMPTTNRDNLTPNETAQEGTMTLVPTSTTPKPTGSRDNLSPNETRQEDSENAVELGGIAIKQCPIWSCENRCFGAANTSSATTTGAENSTADTPKCVCDHSCLTLGDCCVDFFSLCLNITDEAGVVALLKQALSQGQTSTAGGDSDMWNTTELIRSYGTCVVTPEGDMYSMITKCPKDYKNQQTVEICKNAAKYPNLQPYSNKYNMALTFRNVHCARCHGYSENTLLVAWIQGVDCSGMTDSDDQQEENANAEVNVDDILSAIRSGKCRYIYRPPEKTAENGPRHCLPAQGLPDDLQNSQEPNSNTSGKCTFEDLLLCKSYSYETFGSEDTALKNPHCLKCMTGVTPVAVDLPCSRQAPEKDESGTSGSKGGILALFNSDRSGSNSITVNGRHIEWPGFLCADDEVFDDVFLVCRKLYCPPGYLPEDGQCKRTEQVIVPASSQIMPGGTVQLFFRLQVADSVLCEHLKPEVEDRLAELRSAADPAQSKDETAVTCLDSSHPAVASNHTTATLQISINQITNVTESLEELVTVFQTLNENQQYAATGTVTNYDTDPPVVCASGYPELIQSANVSSVDGTLYVVQDGGAFSALYPLDNTAFKVRLSLEDSDNQTVEGSEHQTMSDLHENGLFAKTGAEIYDFSTILCIQPVIISKLNCSSVAFDINRTRIVNGTLFVTGTELSFLPSEYELHDTFALVCSDFKNLNDLWSNTTFFGFTEAQYYVSVALSLTSALCLLLALLAFCLMSELRTLAGHMTAALASSLAIGQLILLLDFIHHRVLCSVLAALSHFCWLAAFSWMSALALHMARTFNGNLASGAGSHSPKHQRKVFRKYCVVGWGLPAVYVVGCYIVDNIPVPAGMVGYGVDVCSWMQQIYVFLVPVAAALLVNIICFVVTLISIERTIRASSTAIASKQASDRKRLLVYAKMSSAMGFTWLFGFIAAFTGETAVWWGYIVLNGLQGTFVAFSFVLNARFFRLLKQKVTVRHRRCRCEREPTSYQNGRRSGALTLQKQGRKPSSQSRFSSMDFEARGRIGSVCDNCGLVKETSFGGSGLARPSTNSTLAND